jgi:hypothetical protein
MDKQKYDEMKKYLDEINALLKEGGLSPEEINKFELIRSQLAGALLSPWLPIGWERKLIMFIILTAGAIGYLTGNHKILFIWLALPLFSPRIIGESLRIIGYIIGKSKI